MYIPETIQTEPDYKRCIEFHGHTCMGVTIGYLAAKLAMKLLEEMHSTDEELIAIVETDACCCDAIQVLTGCTFGKGNFFHHDHGKMAFTFASRNSGKGVRLVLKDNIFTIPEEEKRLAEKISRSEGSNKDIQRYEYLYESRGKRLFANGPSGFFGIQYLENYELPARAPRAASTPCDICGEMVMETKLTETGGHKVCKACIG